MSPQPAPRKSTKSTGPRTARGKAASSRNALLHGLASGTIIMPGEDPAEYAELERSLLAQFQPKNPVETILVTQMGKHHWLSRRAMRLQAEVLNPACRKKGEIPPSLALPHRYQVSNDRAFYKCLETINTLRKQELTGQKQFVSQARKQPLSFAADPLDFSDLLSVCGPNRRQNATQSAPTNPLAAAAS